MIRIAIDGPGGAGKSSVAKELSRRLGMIYVDTGALYRNIGLFMLESGIDPKDSEKVSTSLDKLTLELQFSNGKQVVLLNGIDRGDEIRTPEASMAASAVSAIPSVRQYLLDMQRETARKNNVIMDGRDIGTVILPDAEVKIFLTASPKARAKRRYDELIAKGKDVTLKQVYDEMVERDRNDSTRDVAPCVKAKDAVLLDNSKLNQEQTVDAIIKIIRKKTRTTTAFYSICKAIFGPLFRFFLNIKATGTENVPKDKGVLFCSNHIAAVDIIAIGATCPRQITCIAKKELVSIPLLGGLVRALGAVKIDRSGSDVGAIKTSVGAIKDGKIVTIFPQGHRCPGVNPATTPIKHGAGLIAYHAECDVVPVSIKMKGGKYALFRRTEIVYGKPISFSELGFSYGGRDEYQQATEKVFNEILNNADFASLPDYDPKNDPINNKKRKKRK